ncbi:hypothetical protein KP509_20G074200 [Ceratopteris richardii]|uniref:Uncharacterized protein n=1 Tax=Ceratopteris richardii TaxID=49495 RepID=A0A8T2SH38_CERRI|nr:hypothetical protein KP509_20G074200 [Ceratopteris richardii]
MTLETEEQRRNRLLRRFSGTIQRAQAKLHETKDERAKATVRVVFAGIDDKVEAVRNTLLRRFNGTIQRANAKLTGFNVHCPSANGGEADQIRGIHGKVEGPIHSRIVQYSSSANSDLHGTSSDRKRKQRNWSSVEELAAQRTKEYCKSSDYWKKKLEKLKKLQKMRGRKSQKRCVQQQQAEQEKGSLLSSFVQKWKRQEERQALASMKQTVFFNDPWEVERFWQAIFLS